MNYVIGAFHQKLPRAPLPFNPALVTSTFFNAANFLPKNLRFEHGGPNLSLAPVAIWPRYAPGLLDLIGPNNVLVWAETGMDSPMCFLIFVKIYWVSLPYY